MVSDILWARSQMALSLGFHILFAAVGMAMPVLMVLAQLAGMKTRAPHWQELSRAWAVGTAVFFAIGAVSGTVLSFELGLLFPQFMAQAGALIGMPFSLEGFAFFTEAIFLGLYLYGRDRLTPLIHLGCGVMVALSGLASAGFVTLVNAWMNAPVGFVMEGTQMMAVDPIGAMATPFALHEVPHTFLAAYMTCAMVVSAIHAWALLRWPTVRPELHRAALGVALVLVIPCALLQPVVGHLAGMQVARHQPLKFAAMEHIEQTRTGAPLKVGPLEIPKMLSWMAFGRGDAEVVGLDAFAPADQPPKMVAAAFQLMVALGTLAAGYALWTVWLCRNRRLPRSRLWLWTTVLLGPVGAIAMEAGWIVTEVGRQPWIIYGVMRTKDAVTPVGGQALPLGIFAAIYAVLGGVVATILWRQVRSLGQAH